MSSGKNLNTGYGATGDGNIRDLLMIKTAVVILNWNGRKFLERFLGEVVANTTAPDTEVIIADNNSTDDSVDFLNKNFPSLRVIRLNNNYGYAGGYNRALMQIDADYYILLNSDVSVGCNWTEPLTMFMDLNPRAGACQPRIRSHDQPAQFEYAGAAGGYIDRYGYPFCRGRIFNVVEEDTGQYNNATEVFWASGACMIVRASAFNECKGFDDTFFAHMEEIDLCWRMQNAGYSIHYIPEPVVYHVGGGTLAYNSPFKIYLNFRNSLMMLAKNLPSGRLRRTIFTRQIFDGVAAIVFLFNGGVPAVRAVLKAHRDFRRERSNIVTRRNMTPPCDIYDPPHTMMNRSILFEYYINKRKKYSELKWQLHTDTR
jgi:GT2 family glycosyltransferase